MNLNKSKRIGQRLKAELTIWRVGAMPGIAVISLVILLRLLGGLQFLELVVLDNFLRLRPSEKVDERILIVGINEEDIRSVGAYPIPDSEIAALIRKLASYQPAVIGLDLVRDLPVEPGNDDLEATFAEFNHIIGVEKALPDRKGFKINPPPALPSEQVGFVDALLDNDGNLRRSLLSTSDLKEEFKFSFTILLAQKYLATKEYELGNIPGDEWGMQFTPIIHNNVKENNNLKSVELTRIQPNAGGYLKTDARGNQILLNYRSGKEPFRIVSLEDIKTGKVKPEWIGDRIIIIGMTSLSAKDIINVPAVDGINPGKVYGVEVQAHAVSQIVSAVEDGRPIIKFLSDGWEYLWIVIWGLIGISLARFFRESWLILLGLFATSIILIGVVFLLLIEGWWIPVVPTLIVLVINGAGLTATSFYRYQQDLKQKIQERQLVIDETFQLIHNQPLQTLKLLLKSTKEQLLSNQELVKELENLDRELRAVNESIRRETILDGDIIYIGGVKVDLQEPIKDILYQIYSHTITRNFPCFKTIKVRIVKFEDLDSSSLNIDNKRALCRFLEEALCNVGKHAQGITRLKVICTQQQGQNLIRVEDNGVGIKELSKERKGMGTRQAENLARKLGGKFRRISSSGGGTICELTWSVTKVWFWHF